MDAIPVAAEVGPVEQLPAMRLLGQRFEQADINRAWIVRLDGLIVGACAITRSWTGGRCFGPGCWVEVLPEFRARGVGRVLIAAAATRATRLGARGLHASHALGDPAQVRIVEMLGFDRVLTAVEWTLDAEGVFAECDRVVHRLLARRGGVAAEYLVKPLQGWSEAERDQAVELQVREVGGERSEVTRRVAGTASRSFHRTVSTGILDSKGTMVAVALAMVPDDVAVRTDSGVLESIVVARSCRRGLVTPMLKRAVARKYLDLGGRIFTLATLDPHADTRRNAERLGPLETRVIVRPYMMLHGD